MGDHHTPRRVLALESHVDEIDDEFLRNGMRMIIDGNDHDFVRDVLLEDIAAMEERHRNGAAMFTSAGAAAPTLGVLGAVVGLVAALSQMEDVASLGASIAERSSLRCMGFSPAMSSGIRSRQN